MDASATPNSLHCWKYCFQDKWRRELNNKQLSAGASYGSPARLRSVSVTNAQRGGGTHRDPLCLRPHSAPLYPHSAPRTKLSALAPRRLHRFLVQRGGNLFPTAVVTGQKCYLCPVSCPVAGRIVFACSSFYGRQIVSAEGSNLCVVSHYLWRENTHIPLAIIV